MKSFTMYVVMAIWVFLAIYLPVKLIPFNPFMCIYLAFITWFSIAKVVNFLVWNFFEKD